MPQEQLNGEVICGNCSYTLDLFRSLDILLENKDQYIVRALSENIVQHENNGQESFRISVAVNIIQEENGVYKVNVEIIFIADIYEM
jgi:hypothetical protein